MVRKLSFLCLVFCDIPMEWCINYYFYALCFVIYQWNGSQVVFLCFAFCDIPMKMVRKILFLCFTFCDIPVEWFANYYFYALCLVMYQKRFANDYFYAFQFVIYQWNGPHITSQYPFLFNTCIHKKRMHDFMFIKIMLAYQYI
jgi:hypothetical protein